MLPGPQKTALGGFKGFGFGAKKEATGGVQAPKAKPKASTGSRREDAGSGAVASLFAEAMDERREAKSSQPSWAKPSIEAVQAQRKAQELLAEDPSLFQYDEILDDIQRERDPEAAGGLQAIRTDVLTQKKRVGLTVPVASTEVRTGVKRSAKYIEKVMLATDRRKVEQQVIEDRLLKKEKDARKDCEVFVTAAFKEELKKRQKFVDELEAQEARDQAKAAEKQEHGTGFADMYRNLLNGGLASSRGREQVKEIAPARDELVGTEPKAEVKAAKEEEEEKAALLEDPDAKAELKEEVPSEAAPSYGLAEAGAPQASTAKAELQAREREERDEKTMSARERYLARKRAEAAVSGAAAAG